MRSFNCSLVKFANLHQKLRWVYAVTLSKTKKKPGLERKGKVVAEIKDAVEQYSSAYVFTYDNMRNQKLKDLREQLKSSSRLVPRLSAAMPFCPIAIMIEQSALFRSLIFALPSSILISHRLHISTKIATPLSYACT